WTSRKNRRHCPRELVVPDFRYHFPRWAPQQRGICEMNSRAKSFSEDEFLYGVNPAFEVLLAGRRKIKRFFIDERASGRH
ncbi:MAG: hypothetical protein O2857_22830, partial [Planctomycetota bacterium]|nr:hypothetical protein [Planctomycetota bacterium]